jgi:hypothetical protein
LVYCTKKNLAILIEPPPIPKAEEVVRPKNGTAWKKREND